jgi:DNA (cytosine-5)-methyltransferase 1
VASFDAVHASPPCQFGTALRFAPGTKKDHRNLIPATRGVLQSTGKPYVIENVSAVRRWLIDPVLLCGTMFGLGACGCELHRHRLFETNFGLRAPGPCEHSGGPVMGLYGGHARNRSAKHGGRGTRDLWPGGHWPVAAEAMQMPWATLKGMSEAIPPAYSRHIGRELAYWIDGRIVGSLTHKSRLTTL